jgi:hypothetical protein
VERKDTPHSFHLVERHPFWPFALIAGPKISIAATIQAETPGRVHAYSTINILFATS